MKPPPLHIPLAYLITFRCYGTRLHGDEAGSVDRQHNIPGTSFLPPNPKLVLARTRQLKHEPRRMEAAEREKVLEAIREGCARRGWNTLAVHVRSAHIHMVVAAAETPEKVMTAAKAYATRALNDLDRESDPRESDPRTSEPRTTVSGHAPPPTVATAPNPTPAATKRWTRHGSTRYLWKPEHVSAAIHYVVEEQGTKMAVWPPAY